MDLRAPLAGPFITVTDALLAGPSTRGTEQKVDYSPAGCPGVPAERRTRRGVLASAGSVLAAGCLGVLSSPRSGVPDETPSPAEQPTPPHDSPAPDDAWPQAGRLATRTGFNPAVSHAAPSSGWAVDRAGPVTTPTVVGGTVYVTRGAPGDGDRPVATAEAYALADGSLRWTQPLGVAYRSEGFHSDHRPIYFRGALYANVGDGVVALDAETGERYWTARLDARDTPPVVTDAGAYVAGEAAMYCVGHDGSERWRAAPEADDAGTERWAPALGPPTVGADAVYLSVGRLLVALDPETGGERWRTPTESKGGSVHRAPEAVVVADGEFLEVVGPDGGLEWSTTPRDLSDFRAAVARGTVYLVGARGRVAAYGLQRGERRWHARFGGDAYSAGAVPVALDGGLVVRDVVRTEQSPRVVLRGLDPGSGAVRWSRSRPGNWGRGPVAVGDSLVATAQVLPGDDVPRTARPPAVEGDAAPTTLWALRLSG